MPSATLRIKIGPSSKNYIKVVGKGESYKRGSTSFKLEGEELVVNVSANDPIALLASLNSVLKQLRVVGTVTSLVEKQSKSKSQVKI